MRETIGKLEISCEDCMDLMARYPDKHFDLAIVDPPYQPPNKGMLYSQGHKSRPQRKNIP